MNTDSFIKKKMTTIIFTIIALSVLFFVVRNISTFLNARFIDISLNTSSLIQKNALFHFGNYTYDNGEFFALFVTENNKELVDELHKKLNFTTSDKHQANLLYRMSPYSHNGNDMPTDSHWSYAEGTNTQGTNRYKVVIGEDSNAVIIIVEYPDHSGDN